MKLYNTLSRHVEELTPQHPPKVTVYTCGPTVYDYPHIGNWFTFIRYDILIRALKVAGFEPDWVMNITDVGHLTSDADEGEDKLEKGARREGKSAWDIAKFYEAYFQEGLDRLNISHPQHLPKATDHIQAQIDLIKQLETKGFTYHTSDGVYFDTSKLRDYGKLAKLDIEHLQAGARVAVNPEKKHPSDFALWKFSPKDSRRDMEWDSPWGKGFPGWHLECSAMSMQYLGETLDIHAGGIDHIPVHHTNEIAQSEAATGKPFALFWVHMNHITINEEKIAKSLGNGLTLEDIQQKGFSPDDLRLLVLQSHYRTQAEFSWDNLEAVKNRLKSLEEWADLRYQADDETVGSLGNDYFSNLKTQITAALGDDLKTPEVLRILSEAQDHMYKYGHGLSPTNEAEFEDFLEFLDTALGLRLSQRPDISSEQRQLIQERQQARQAHDWAKADQLRNQLAEQQIGLRDTEHAQQWYRL